MLNATDAVGQVSDLIKTRDAERTRLDRIQAYYSGKNPDVWLSSGVPEEVRRLAQIAKVPVCKLVVDSVVQSLYVDGYRSKSEEVAYWDIWQRNRLDRDQMGVHRSASKFGSTYTLTLEGEPSPKITHVPPHRMTALYGEGEYPMWALETQRTGIGKSYRLFDDEYWYRVGDEATSDHYQDLHFIESGTHHSDVCPVVRFPDVVDDDDGGVRGEVEPLIPLQDQINITTFALLVAQHYGAFRQRYIIGWLAETEELKLKAAASELWTFEDSPENVKVGEFGQTDLKGYIDSREATLRHLATISQTPVNELTGTLVNLGAEALVAARDANNRKMDERKTVRGESWEQTLDLGGRYLGFEADPAAFIRWRDTDARALSGTADSLGKFASMLGIPPEALWERAAEAMGAPQQEVESWRSFASQETGLDSLRRTLENQAS